MKTYCYYRVSTDGQDFQRQEKAISEYASENGILIDRTFSDKYTGKTFDREQYQEMKALLQRGDAVIIKELDRLSRDYDGIKSEWEWFMANDINVIVVDMPLISGGARGKTLDNKLIANIVFELLCYLAQKEREKISQRTKEALQARKAKGVVLGRKADEKLPQQILSIKSFLAFGLSAGEIVEKMNGDCGKTKVYNIIGKINKGVI